MDEELKSLCKITAIACVSILFVIVAFMFAFPPYNVWRAEMKGRAELRQAEQNKQIAVETAKAKKESAKMLADAEIERAKGVAEANTIIGDSLTGNEAYLRYLWIQGLQDNNNAVIYVPTETNLPIMEASRHLLNASNNDPLPEK